MAEDWDGEGGVRAMAEEGTRAGAGQAPLSVLYTVTHLLLLTTPEGTGQDDPHFIEEVTDALKHRDQGTCPSSYTSNKGYKGVLNCLLNFFIIKDLKI